MEGEVQTRKDEHDMHLDEPLEGEEIFLDQLKDAFIFFTAVTVAAMDVIAHARHHYQQRENHPRMHRICAAVCAREDKHDRVRHESS